MAVGLLSLWLRLSTQQGVPVIKAKQIQWEPALSTELRGSGLWGVNMKIYVCVCVYVIM